MKWTQHWVEGWPSGWLRSPSMVFILSSPVYPHLLGAKGIEEKEAAGSSGRKMNFLEPVFQEVHSISLPVEGVGYPWWGQCTA